MRTKCQIKTFNNSVKLRTQEVKKKLWNKNKKSVNIVADFKRKKRKKQEKMRFYVLIIMKKKYLH